jgi:hypothetical protein
MDAQEEALSAARKRRTALLPGLICGVVAIVLLRTGILSFFFLIPLGLAAAAYNIQTACLSAAGLILLGSILPAALEMSAGVSLAAAALETLYVSVTVLAFLWIMAPPFRGSGFPGMRTLYRFVAGSAAAALVLVLMIGVFQNDKGFSAFITAQAEMLSSLYISQAGSDEVRRSMLERYVTPQRVAGLMREILLKGGGLASSMLLFFISRQIAFFFAGIGRRRRRVSGIADFHAPAGLIWVLSFALLGVLLFRIIKLVPLEYAAWNILILCGIIYFAQGGGIAAYTLSRRAMPSLLRLFLNIVIILAIFSPGINVFVLGGLILLGIAENWLPLRAAKENGSSSTPGI